jgi:hypothetical protein
MRTPVALAALAIPLIAACGATPARNNGQSGGSSVASSSPSGGASNGTVGKSYWYGGFKVTLGKITVVKAIKPTPPKYSNEPEKVLIEATFENLGKDNFTPYNQDLVLQSGTSSYLQHDSTDEKLPGVPGLQSTAGVIAFVVDEKFSLNNAVLLVGNANYNQASVPLGNSGKYVSLEPQKVAISGTIAIPDRFQLAVSGGTLSYDDPSNHQEEKAGEVVLIVTYAITGNSDSTCCFGAENAILKLPDGTAIAARKASGYAIPGKGLTTPDQVVEWIMKSASGAYDFIVKGKYGPKQEDVQADLAFNLQVGVSATSSGTPPAGGSFPSPSPVPEATPSGH